VNPDPDGLASQLALALYLKALGKKVYILNEEELPQRFHFMPGAKMIKRFQADQKAKVEVALIVDCGDLDRIGALKKLAQEAEILINIDHHITNDHFGDLNMVEPHASSTAEVIYDLFKQAKFSLTRDIALLLYLGIMTDTGSFRYDNTTGRTHEIISQLMQHDFSVGEMYKKLYETIPLNDLKYFTKVVNDFEPLYGGKVICLELYQSMLKRFSEAFDLRDKIFTYLRAIQGVEVIVIFTELDQEKTRVNLRSQGQVDVAKIAYHFDGGGHSRASGCLVFDNIKKARQKVLKKIRRAL